MAWGFRRLPGGKSKESPKRRDEEEKFDGCGCCTGGGAAGVGMEDWLITYPFCAAVIKSASELNFIPEPVACFGACEK